MRVISVVLNGGRLLAAKGTVAAGSRLRVSLQTSASTGTVSEDGHSLAALERTLAKGSEPLRCCEAAIDPDPITVLYSESRPAADNRPGGADRSGLCLLELPPEQIR